MPSKRLIILSWIAILYCYIIGIICIRYFLWFFKLHDKYTILQTRSKIMLIMLAFNMCGFVLGTSKIICIQIQSFCNRDNTLYIFFVRQKRIKKNISFPSLKKKEKKNQFQNCTSCAMVQKKKKKKLKKIFSYFFLYS